MRDFEQTTRSVVVARQAMAATSHPTATLSAMQVMAAGGNALDAAIAACAVQCVVEPGSTGIGGDCFALLAPNGTDGVIGYNGSGRVPAGLSLDAVRAAGHAEIPRQSPLSVTVPGAIDAWTRLHADHGRMPWRDVLAPAIALAQDGYAISPRVHRDWALAAPMLASDPAARRIFLPRGRAPAIGETHRQPELAATLRAIAEHGREAFYGGAVAQDIVETLRARGGTHSLADFASAAGAYVEPIRTRFRDHDVYECPPNGQGVIALMILNILSRFAARGEPGGPERLHLEIEATRLAYAAREGLLADPAMTNVPVGELLSETMADRLAALIDPERAMSDLPTFETSRHRDTVYISVVDKDRNAVSFINSIFDSFGSGIVAPRSGVILHNRGQSFSLDPGHPNALAPGKRPMHTIIPGMLAKDGRAVMPFGVMGGHYQAMGHAHFLSKVLDYGMDMQMAIDLPRVMPVSGSLDVEAEHTLPADTVAGLEKRGFRLVSSDGPIGGAQAIFIDWANGTLTGASESRKDGCAIGM